MSTAQNCSSSSASIPSRKSHAARIARAIEYTRFPYLDTPKGDIDDLNEEEGLLLRAADLIGQLGDPNYMIKRYSTNSMKLG